MHCKPCQKPQEEEQEEAERFLVYFQNIGSNEKQKGKKQEVNKQREIEVRKINTLYNPILVNCHPGRKENNLKVVEYDCRDIYQSFDERKSSNRHGRYFYKVNASYAKTHSTIEQHREKSAHKHNEHIVFFDKNSIE